MGKTAKEFGVGFANKGIVLRPAIRGKWCFWIPPTFGSTIMRSVEQAFWELDAPIGRVCSEEVPIIRAQISAARLPLRQPSSTMTARRVLATEATMVRSSSGRNVLPRPSACRRGET